MSKHYIVEKRNTLHDTRIKELENMIIDEKNKQSLLSSNIDSDWIDLRKKIFREYAASFPHSFGHLKGSYKKRRNDMATQYNEILIDYDNFYNLNKQEYFYIYPN
jgi:hypothetical protein